MAEMNQTPKGMRVHIGIFGRRNAGKSSVINALTKQNIALVSDVAGTTTDPVFKAMEILPLGPVMIIDTAGIDDIGDLGKLRIGKTKEVMTKTDVAVIVIDAANDVSDFERSLVSEFKKLGTTYILAANKIETVADPAERIAFLDKAFGEKVVPISALKKKGIDELRSLIVKTAPEAFEDGPMLRDLVKEGDTVVLCVPIDTVAPKGRIILPQVHAIRDILDANAKAVVVKENQLAEQLDNLKEPPALVVTDSQVFAKADRAVPKEIPLTSFSILMARQKGNLSGLAAGAKAVENLKPGDKVLIAEACTHVCQAEDIGRVKIPAWLNKKVGGELNYEWYTGDSFPEDVSSYKLVIHCGACMINRRAMLSRQKKCAETGVSIVNYGVLISYLHGIMDRAMSPMKDN